MEIVVMVNKFNDIANYLNNDKLFRKTENANWNESISGLKSYIVNKYLANYALACLPKNIAKAHSKGDIHIHNLDGGMLQGYCHGGSLKSILLKGINTPSVNSSPAKHFNSVLDHIMNYLFMSQLEWSGAQSVSDFDTLLAPFIKYDRLSYKEVKQDIQRFIYNLNFALREAFQCPFTNISLNFGVPKSLEEQNVVVGGKQQKETYSDFYNETLMINKAIAEVLMEKDANGNPFTFPIPTINITKKVDLDSEIFKLILAEVSYLGSYYFMNYVGSGIDEDTIRSMCCRLNLDLRQLSKGRGVGLWNMSEGTGSVGVVTINLSRLGYLFNDEDKMLDRLGYLMDLAKKQLLIKRKNVEQIYNSNKLPIAKYYGLNLDNYFLTIGLLGINEMCVNFTGKPLSETPKFAKKILMYMRKCVMQMQRDTHIPFNLEMTPAEGSSYRLALIDRKTYPKIFTQGTIRTPYYTSLLVPPNENLDLLSRLKIEEQLLPLFTGGTIFRVYIQEEPDLDSLNTLIKKLTSTKIPYFDVTCTFSVCNRDGKYLRGIHEKCPECGSTTDVFSRVVGYYRPVRRWNVGKQQEFKERKYIKIT